MYKIELELFFERTNYDPEEKIPDIKQIDTYIKRGKRLETYVYSIISECYHTRIKNFWYENNGKLVIIMEKKESDENIDKFFLWLRYQPLEDIFSTAKPNTCAIYPTRDKKHELGMIDYNRDKIKITIEN